MSDTTATTTPGLILFGVLGVATAAMTSFGAPWWVWTGIATWGGFSVIAILGQSEAESRKFLSGTLRKSTYTQIYTGLVGRSHDRLWAAYCDPVEKGAGLGAMFRAALTWRLYDRALLLAVVYPILLPVMWWLVTGSAAQLGPVVFLDATGFRDVWPERVFVIGSFVLILLGWQALKLSQKTKPFWHVSLGWLFVATFSLALFVAGVVPLAAALVPVSGSALIFGVTRSIGGAFVFAGAIALSGGVVVTGTVTGAFIFGCVGAYSIELLDNRGRPKLPLLIVTLAALGVWAWAALAVTWGDSTTEVRTVFVFLAILPLLNALFDVISYAVTLSFIRRGRVSRLPVLYGLADLGIAMVLFVALGVAMVAVVAGLNGLAGTEILDLGALLRDVRDQPGSYWWLYGIAFSTILPTALHAALALLGVQGLWPKGIRRAVAGWIGNASASQIDATRGAFALGLLWAVPVWVIVAFGWAAWHWGGTLATTLAKQYLTVLERVAAALGAG